MGTRRSLLRPAHWPRPVRRFLTGIAVIAVVVAMGLTGYRTLRPAETVSRATQPLPSPEPIKSIQYAELPSAPLIVEGRLRVYAEQRRVFADTPVTAQREMTPHWAYRRWPAEVVSVAAVEKSDAGGNTSVVITKWSDGEVVALAVETGDVVWQHRVEPPSSEAYNGRRTGARTMYEPEGLFTTVSSIDQRPIIVVTGKDVAEAIDPWTGTVRWTRNFGATPGCRHDDWTGETTYLVKDTCSKPAVLEVYDAASGAQVTTWRPSGASLGPDSVTNWFLQPAACQLGRSGCKLFKAAATGEAVSYTDAASGLGKITPAYWSVTADGVVQPERFADKDNVAVVGDMLVQQVVTNYIWAYSRSTGRRLWMSEVAGELVGADQRNVYLVNREFQLIVLNLATGAVTSSTELRIRPHDRWVFRETYLHGGYFALERLQTTRESDVDDKYYFTINPIVLVGI